MTESTEARQCQARHGQHMDRQCKFYSTALAKHDGLHMYTDITGFTYSWTDLEAMWPAIPNDYVPASERQVGGNHYRKHAIQPWDVWDEYDLDRYTANAVKYILRAGDKGPRVEDLEKAKHYIEKAIEREKGN